MKVSAGNTKCTSKCYLNKPHHMIEDGGYSKQVNRASMPFPEKESWEEKSLYALKLIGKGSAADIAGKIAELEETENVSALEEHVEKALSGLCQKKQLDCSLDEQVMIYSAG